MNERTTSQQHAFQTGRPSRTPFSFLAVAILFIAAAAQLPADDIIHVNCGAEGQRACQSSDPEYHVQYNFASTVPGETYDGTECERGLANVNGTCVGRQRYRLGPNETSAWLKSTMYDQMHGMSADLPVNLVSIFGTHNSFSNYVDGSFDPINADQEFSISDQLNAGARVIRLDPRVYSSNGDREFRLCHSSQSDDNSCRWTSYGRLFPYALAEIKFWLDHNPGEVLVIRFNRTSSADWWRIEQSINAEFGRDILLLPATPGNSNRDTWDPISKGGWPTLRQMRSMGKRVIIMDDNGTNDTFKWSDYVLDDGYTDATPQFSLCQNQKSQDVRQRSFYQWSYIGEDRSDSNAFSGTPGSGLMGPSDVSSATACGFGLINVDFLLAGSSAPRGYSFPDPDTRRESAIWSWVSDETGTRGPALAIGTNWLSASPNEQHPFACAYAPTGVNASLYDWVITAATGTWDQGNAICASERGAKFWAPQSGFEAQRLSTQIFSPPNWGRGVWINYQKSDNAQLDRTTGTFHLTQGDKNSDGATLLFHYTGGKGGPLFFALHPASTSFLNAAPQLDPAAKTITVGLDGRLFRTSDNALTLAPGRYVQDVDFREIDPDTGVTRQETITVVLYVAPQQFNVVVDTRPASLTVVVDGTTYAAPATFTWSYGSIHAIDAETIGQGNREYLFHNWNDGGAAKHAITVKQAATWVANFDLYYRLTLTAEPSNGGTIAATGTHSGAFYLAGREVTVTATPAANFYLRDFAGDLSGNSTGQKLLMSKPLLVVAHFVPDPPTTISSSSGPLSVTVDGATLPAPATFTWTPGTGHTLGMNSPQAADPGAQFVFTQWSDGVTSNSRSIQAGIAPVNYKVVVAKQFAVTASANAAAGGTVSGTGWYTAGTSATLTATPAPGYAFTGFSSSSPVNSSTTTFTVTAPIQLVANFKLKSGG